jgi:hypothetical protein
VMGIFFVSGSPRDIWPTAEIVGHKRSVRDDGMRGLTKGSSHLPLVSGSDGGSAHAGASVLAQPNSTSFYFIFLFSFFLNLKSF